MEIDKNKKKSQAILEEKKATVMGLDLSFQGIRSLSNAEFLHFSLKELLLNNNNIENIPKSLFEIKSLVKLDLSCNKIKSIPPELGHCINIKELYLQNNMITSIPLELGTLYQLETLNLSNNPLIKPFSNLYKDGDLIAFCRDNNTNYKAPNTRSWIPVDDIAQNTSCKSLTVGTFNILANYFAEKCTYAPSWVITSECRKDTILKTIVGYNLDIIGLQEIEGSSYFNIYRDYLFSKANYDSSFYERPALSFQNNKRSSDGCAIFWKSEMFTLVEEFRVNFLEKIINDPRLRNNSEIYDIYNNRNHIALIVVLKLNNGDHIIIANTHLFWEPGYDDIRILQLMYLLEDLERIRIRYKNAPIILLGDLNTERNSEVYKVITERKISSSFLKFSNLNFLNNDSSIHTLKLYDSYIENDEGFTTFTPYFIGNIDYIFHSDELVTLETISLVEDEYTKRTIGLPNIHFPSDHIIIGAKLSIKPIQKNNFYSKPK